MVRREQILQEKQLKNAAAWSENELHVGGVTPAFTVGITYHTCSGQSNYK